MLRILLALLIFFSFASNLIAQDKIVIADFEVIDGDTIFFSEVPEVEILEFKSKEDRAAYFILKRRVLKVYPYAIIASSKLNEIRAIIDSIPKRRHKKRYTKEVTKWVKDEYSARLRNLTMKEGKILVKLIYRETNITSYDIVKSYRGRFNAFFWQSMAKLWDNNLRTRYSPQDNKEDMLIEHILIQAKLEGVLE